MKRTPAARNVEYSALTSATAKLMWSMPGGLLQRPSSRPTSGGMLCRVANTNSCTAPAAIIMPRSFLYNSQKPRPLIKRDRLCDVSRADADVFYAFYHMALRWCDVHRLNPLRLQRSRAHCMRQGTADALQRELSRRLDCHLFDCHPHTTALQCSAQSASRGASTMPSSGRSPMLQARELLSCRTAAG